MKNRICLAKLNVQSFVTNLQASEALTIVGGKVVAPMVMRLTMNQVGDHCDGRPMIHPTQTQK